jgi:putative transposase
MGLEALCPKPNLSKPAPGHRIYPYLMKGLNINRPNQAWCSDITYIRLNGGFVYLVAIMDWYSRKILSWELSNSMDASFCVKALQRAIALDGPGLTPKI